MTLDTGTPVCQRTITFDHAYIEHSKLFTLECNFCAELITYTIISGKCKGAGHEANSQSRSGLINLSFSRCSGHNHRNTKLQLFLIFVTCACKNNHRTRNIKTSDVHRSYEIILEKTYVSPSFFNRGFYTLAEIVANLQSSNYWLNLSANLALLVQSFCTFELQRAW